MVKIFKADQRFQSTTEWVATKSLFSFQLNFDATNVQYGRLIAFNDYELARDNIFPRHPHENKDQIFLVLDGALKTTDNLGNIDTLRFGDVQCIVAGEGYSRDGISIEPQGTRYLGIWLEPQEKDTPPRYKVLQYPPEAFSNTLTRIVGPESDAITSDTNLFIGRLDKIDLRHPLDTQRRHLMYLCEGNCTLRYREDDGEDAPNGIPLGAGDHVRMENECELHLVDCNDAVIVLLSL